MSEPVVTYTVEELRQAGLGRERAGDFDGALELYDAALSQACTDEERELITINKAAALIAIDRNGSEVQVLPSILMRRRNPHHTFLAAYALTYKHRLQNDCKRGIFYGQIALEAATEAKHPARKVAVLNELGVVYEMDSQFEKAIECFDEALPLLDSIESAEQRKVSRTAILQNLGYNKLLVGQTVEGIDIILGVMSDVDLPSARAESLIDLCYGYVELGQFEKARWFGEEGLRLAEEPRQIRNAHYLLGETAYKCGDTDAAEFHFDELSKFYPQFRNLKNLLFAIDLRGMVNLKL
ncbi:MAG TPA: hypothetical protein VFN10_21650 [Thermoanaerobaculia bacterium]|nr:hypothetical protein [Thermoanaerobaculia bacterium]